MNHGYSSRYSDDDIAPRYTGPCPNRKLDDEICEPEPMCPHHRKLLNKERELLNKERKREQEEDRASYNARLDTQMQINGCLWIFWIGVIALVLFGLTY